MFVIQRVDNHVNDCQPKLQSVANVDASEESPKTCGGSIFLVWDLECHYKKTSHWKQCCIVQKAESQNRCDEALIMELYILFDIEGNKILAFKAFLCGVFRVSKNRVGTNQGKFATSSDLGDKLGKHEKLPNKLHKDVKKLIGIHC